MSHLLSTVENRLEGSSIRDLAMQVSFARSAVHAALDAVSRIEIHPRDYVGRGDEHVADLAAQRSMILRLRHIREELDEATESIVAVLD